MRKKRCDYCERLATILLEYKSRRFPSGKIVRAYAATCATHEGSVAWRGMLDLKLPEAKIIRLDPVEVTP